MTRNSSSTLGQFADIVISIEVSKEACPLGIAPTSSTTLTLALGDAIAVCMMHARDFKKEDFASFHPGGSLGRQLFVKVSDLMRSDDLPLVSRDAPVKEAILAISEGRLGTALLVDENKKLLGLISDGDIRRALLKEGFSLDEKISEYATMNPMTIRDENMLASDALVLIEQKKIQLMVVTDENNSVKGVLHIHKLIEEGIK
jgi:arabinose-5-phosphate isomerase